jgi:hypothetical protein
MPTFDSYELTDEILRLSNDELGSCTVMDLDHVRAVAYEGKFSSRVLFNVGTPTPISFDFDTSQRARACFEAVVSFMKGE